MSLVGPPADLTGAPVAPGAPASLRARTTVPERPQQVVRRPRVEERLREAVRRRLTLVSAGPGWGKTTTVAEWARSRPGVRVAWLSVEPVDDTPAAFWSDVVDALRASGAVPASHPLASVRVPARVSPDLVRRLLRDVELLPEPVVLVLDDFHHITGADVLGAVDDLLRYPLPLHLVVLTRADPVLELQRLRVQDEMVAVGVDELAFDGPAVRMLGEQHGRALDRTEVLRLLAETGGWAVGVRVRVDSPLGPAGQAGAERSAAEFLLAEVLDRQDPVVRRFLLRTSVTSAVCVDLAAVLDPGAPAGRLLPELAATNGFVAAYGSQGSWFRYHPLLRDLLHSRLRLEDPAGETAAHRAAARWLARHGEPLRALQHAVVSQDWSLVGDVFVDVAAACLVSPYREAVIEVLVGIPFSELELDVGLHLCAGSLALVTGRFERARRHADAARAMLAEGPEQPVAAVLLELLVAATARSQGDVQALAAAGAAAEGAVAEVPFPFPSLDTYRSLAVDHRASGLAWCGVRPMLAPSRAPAETSGAGQGAGEEDPLLGAQVLVSLGTRAALALHDAAAGRLAEAEAGARATVEGAMVHGWGAHVQTRAAYAALAWVRLLRAEHSGAERLLATGLVADVGGTEPASELAVRLLQVLVATQLRHARAARSLLADTDGTFPADVVPPLLADLRLRARTEVDVLSPGAPAGHGRAGPSGDVGDDPVARVCQARLLLASGRPEAALRAVAGLPEATGLDDLTRVEAALVEASALERPDPWRAERALALALEVAAPERLARPFLVVPTSELDRHLAEAVAGRHDELSRRLRTRLRAPAPPAEPSPLLEPLTQRELAILGALPTMESNAEIAEDFFVSVNTVKFHLKSLYRKLDVASRREAVRRGRELGLVPR